MKNKAITMMIELMITLRDIEDRLKDSDGDANYEVNRPKYLCVSN
ncbi:hypothetical protein R9X47_07780 [Wukongibacter baidiensis]